MRLPVFAVVRGCPAARREVRCAAARMACRQRRVALAFVPGGYAVLSSATRAAAGKACAAALCLLGAVTACAGRSGPEAPIYRTVMPLVCLTAPGGGAAGPSHPTADLTREELLDQGRVGWSIKAVIPFNEPVNGKSGGSCRTAAFFVLQHEVQQYS